VIVAVLVVGVVQVARHNIIDMIAVPDGLVTAGRAMLVLGFVLLAVVVRRAVDRVRGGDRHFAHLRLHLHLFLLPPTWLAEPTRVHSADERRLTDVNWRVYWIGLERRRQNLIIRTPRGAASARRAHKPLGREPFSLPESPAIVRNPW
jgi:hypothetical protein